MLQWDSVSPRTVLFIYLLIGCLLYGAFLQNPFMMDDEIQILSNTHLHSLENLPSFFQSSTMDSGGRSQMGGIYYKPLMTTIWAVIWDRFGAQSWAFRSVHLLLHVASAFLIYLLSFEFIKKSREACFLIGLLFLIHPMNSEVVLYIADLQDVLYLFWGLLTLFFIRRLEKSFAILSATFTTLLLAFFSKETGLLFSAIAMAFVLIKERTKWVPVAGAVVAATVLYGGARISAGLTSLHYSHLLFPNAPWIDRWLSVPWVLTHYIEILLFPWRLSLATDFQPGPWNFLNLGIPLLVCAILAGFFWKLSRWWFRWGMGPDFVFFCWVLFCWFLLHSQALVPLDGVVADRWAYLFSWPAISLIVVTARFRLAGVVRKRVAMAVTVLILMALSARTVARAMDWTDALAFYQRESEILPWDAVMKNNVGVELFRRGRVAEAGSYFQESVKINSHWSTNWSNLGVFHERQGREALAEECYRKAIAFGVYPLAYENLAFLLKRQGRTEELRQFLTEKALKDLSYNPTLLRIKDELSSQR